MPSPAFHVLWLSKAGTLARLAHCLWTIITMSVVSSQYLIKPGQVSRASLGRFWSSFSWIVAMFLSFSSSTTNGSAQEEVMTTRGYHPNHITLKGWTWRLISLKVLNKLSTISDHETSVEYELNSTAKNNTARLPKNLEDIDHDPVPYHRATRYLRWPMVISTSSTLISI